METGLVSSLVLALKAVIFLRFLNDQRVSPTPTPDRFWTPSTRTLQSRWKPYGRRCTATGPGFGLKVICYSPNGKSTIWQFRESTYREHVFFVKQNPSGGSKYVLFSNQSWDWLISNNSSACPEWATNQFAACTKPRLQHEKIWFCQSCCIHRLLLQKLPVYNII